MRVKGADKLAKQFKKMPAAVERNLKKSVRLNTERTAKLARALAPVDSGELKGWIFTQYDEGGLQGSVEAAPPTKEAQQKARAVEFGRKNGNRGQTNPAPYIRIAQQHTGKKFKNSVKSAIRRGLKEATNG